MTTTMKGAIMKNVYWIKKDRNSDRTFNGYVNTEVDLDARVFDSAPINSFFGRHKTFKKSGKKFSQF